MIYVYAIAERGGAPLPDGLASVDHGGLAGIYGAPPDSLEPNLERLRAHEDVVESLMEDRALLPMRFGSVLDGEAALRELLDARRDEFTAALERVRGRIELGVRASSGGPRGQRAAVGGGAAAARPGSAYIAERLAARRMASELHEALAPAAHAAASRVVAAGDFAGAYLVDRDAVRDFCTRVDDLRVDHPGLEIALTGPWPPYSFTGATS